MQTALVIVDIQNEYFPGGKRELEGPRQAAECAATLVSYFREHSLPIVFIQHVSAGPQATAFVAGSKGVAIHSLVEPRPGETVFQKHYPNSFRETPLLDHLTRLGVKRVVIAGMMTHMCVDATTRAAFDYGFECLIAQDACATRALAFEGTTVPADHVHRAFLAALHGTYGTVLPVDKIIDRISAGES